MKNISSISLICLLLACHSEQSLTARAVQDIQANKEDLKKTIEYLVDAKMDKINVKDINDSASRKLLTKMRITNLHIRYAFGPYGKYTDLDSTVIFNRHTPRSGGFQETIYYYFGKEPKKLDSPNDIDGRISYSCFKRKQLVPH